MSAKQIIRKSIEELVDKPFLLTIEKMGREIGEIEKKLRILSKKVYGDLEPDVNAKPLPGTINEKSIYDKLLFDKTLLLCSVTNSLSEKFPLLEPYVYELIKDYLKETIRNS